MLTSKEAVTRLDYYRNSLGIPAQAKLSLLEKRLIELADRNEIEAVIPMPAPADEADDDGHETEAIETAAASVEEEGEQAIPVYTERLAWVGKYVHQIFFWELALDETGTLIRLRKSR